MSSVIRHVEAIRGRLDWNSCFAILADKIERLREGDECVLSTLVAEQSDFIRFNGSKVRQIGSVSHGKLTLRLINGERQAYATLTVTGEPAIDFGQAASALATLRQGLRDAPNDPHLMIDQTVWAQSIRRAGTLPEPGALVHTVAERAKRFDFVGFYAGGSIARGFASSKGSRGWYEVENFHFSWSLCGSNGRAIKSSYSGESWDDDTFAAKIELGSARLPMLSATAHALAPGSYRAYLAPAAARELLGRASRSGFSARSQASARSELYKLHAGQAAFDAAVDLTEDIELGITPGFNSDGYERQTVPLVRLGRSAGQLVDARSAREYRLSPNGAPASESPTTLSMAGGDLVDDDTLEALGTGLYIGNLWYVNISDQMNCRLTGMTRFATFWVEHGKIVAPVEAMRFDDSLYRLLGSELERLGCQSELLLSDNTWGERSTGGMKLPGWLVRSITLTL
jgi:predicted Zn-dependent protease